jgi:hypothetical protein
MAQLAEGIHFSGTIGNLTFYQRWGRTYVRTKGSVTRERVLEGKEYSKTRQYANKLALASRMASPVYRTLPADVRARWIFRSITGDAASLLYKGMNEKEVTEVLWKKYIGDIESNKNKINPQASNPCSSTKETKNKLRKLFLDRWEKQGKYLPDFKMAWKDPRSYDPETVKRISDPYGFLQYFGKRRE